MSSPERTQTELVGAILARSEVPCSCNSLKMIATASLFTLMQAIVVCACYGSVTGAEVASAQVASDAAQSTDAPKGESHSKSILLAVNLHELGHRALSSSVPTASATMQHTSMLVQSGQSRGQPCPLSLHLYNTAQEQFHGAGLACALPCLELVPIQRLQASWSTACSNQPCCITTYLRKAPAVM